MAPSDVKQYGRQTLRSNQTLRQDQNLDQAKELEKKMEHSDMDSLFIKDQGN